MNCFISGWAFPPPPTAANSIDITKIVAEYKTIENIALNFDKIFPKEIKTLTTWSMSSIIALGVIDKIQAKKIILYSPAFKFEAIEELKMLRQNIIQNKDVALKLFARKCGIPKDLINTSYYTTQELLAGLDFLENTEIKPPQVPPNTKVIVVYGENDKIISPDSSKFVAEKLGVKAVMIENGEHFFQFN